MVRSVFSGDTRYGDEARRLPVRSRLMPGPVSGLGLVSLSNCYTILMLQLKLGVLPFWCPKLLRSFQVPFLTVQPVSVGSRVAPTAVHRMAHQPQETVMGQLKFSAGPVVSRCFAELTDVSLPPVTDSLHLTLAVKLTVR